MNNDGDGYTQATDCDDNDAPSIREPWMFLTIILMKIATMSIVLTLAY